MKTSKAKCDNDICKIYGLYGKVTKDLLKKHPECVSYEVIKRIYGNMELGLISNNIPISAGQRVNISKQRIIEDIMRLQEYYGYISKSLYSQYGVFNSKVIRRIFGSYTNMYDEIGAIKDPKYYIPSDKALKIFTRISELLNDSPIYEKTFNWLINPISKKPLYIDAYYPNANIAIEYHGRQHYEYVDFFHKEYKQFEYEQNVDNIKASLLRKYNIPLYIIPYDIKPDELTDVLNTIKG